MTCDAVLLVIKCNDVTAPFMHQFALASYEIHLYVITEMEFT